MPRRRCAGFYPNAFRCVAMNNAALQPDRRRRRVVFGGAALCTLGACGFSLEQGLTNACHAELPRRLLGHEEVLAAWNGIDSAQVWDCHAHLLGTGDSDSGIWLSPRMESLLHPLQFAQRLFFLNAGCAHDAPGRVDASYIERIHNLIDGMRPGYKLMLLAFDRNFDESGAEVRERTVFHVPDAYTRLVASRHPQYFEWVASVHPYRSDCIAALEAAQRNGARAVKWLPAAMGIDPASPRCDPFYAALARLDMPLITHAGMERALAVGDSQSLGNPLRLRRALDHRVRVVVAHCATLGEDRDLDRGANGPYVPSFDLFARLMDDAQYGRTLHGDLSAVTQVNRAGPALRILLERDDWHGRLHNGSDYPLPGVMPLYSLEQLARLRVIAPALIPLLSEIRQYNPLLFDFVLKRRLRAGGRHFHRRVFETRPFFAGVG